MESIGVPELRFHVEAAACMPDGSHVDPIGCIILGRQLWAQRNADPGYPQPMAADNIPQGDAWAPPWAARQRQQHQRHQQPQHHWQPSMRRHVGEDQSGQSAGSSIYSLNQDQATWTPSASASPEVVGQGQMPIASLPVSTQSGCTPLAAHQFNPSTQTRKPSGCLGPCGKKSPSMFAF